MLGRLNGLFRGVLAEEAGLCRRTYYFVEVIEGTAIDQLDELDEIWLGKRDTHSRRLSIEIGPVRHAVT